VLSTAASASALIAAMTALIGLPLAGPLVDGLRIPADFRADAVASYQALLATVVASLVATPFVGLLMSRNRYDLVDVVPALGQAAYAGLAVLAFSWRGPSLRVLALAYLVAHVASLAVLAIRSRRELLGARLRLEVPEVGQLKTLLGFSTQLLVINMSVLLTYQADNLVISRLIGVGAVAHYTVAATLILRFRQLCYGLSRTFMPATADPATTAERLRELHFRGTRYNTLLIGCLGAVSAALAAPFFALWLGESYRGSGAIFALLMAANMVGMSQYVTNAVLTGLRHTRPLMISEIAGAAANLALSIGLVKAGLGLTGVALGTFIPMIARNAWLAVHGASTVRAPFGPYLRRIYLPAAVTIALTALVLRILVGLGWTERWGGLVFAGVLGFAVFGLLAWRLVLDAGDRARLDALMRRRGASAPAPSVAP
jgi:O-antigen/teichoic acid export membrane protein